MQNRIVNPGKLLDESGGLIQKGYSTRHLLDYNPQTIGLYRRPWQNRMRLKEWDYYGITAENFFFSACVADIGYMGLIFAYFVDFETGEILENILPTPLGYGCSLPKSSKSGDIRIENFGVKLEFLRRPGRRILRLYWKRFHGGVPLMADLELEQPEEMDSIVMATPIAEKRFYYNQKINCMPTAGELRVGGKVHRLDADRNMACLDWGRGVWDYSTFWNWASASGRLADGRSFGLNLGCGFGDLSYASENCIFLEGRMTKLGALDLDYDRNDYRRPWHMRTDDERLELLFEPFVEKVSKTNLLLAKMEGHQMFGRYSGRVLTKDDEELEIDGLIGWAEEHVSKW